jgi:hypothetical protein
MLVDPRVALLWLALIGSDPATAPSALPDPLALQSTAPVTWIGEWLVRGERRALRTLFTPIAGRKQFAGRLTWTEGTSTMSEDWIGRYDGRAVLLSRSGVGGARLTVDNGDLIGTLSRHDAAGRIRLSPRP